MNYLCLADGFLIGGLIFGSVAGRGFEFQNRAFVEVETRFNDLTFSGLEYNFPDTGIGCAVFQGA